MSTTVFEGRSGVMRKSPWLASEDLDGVGEVEVEIEAAHKHTNVEMDQGRKEPLLFSLKFAGKERELILNATNRRRLVELFGTDVRKWKGNKITLLVKPVKAFGKTTNGIRIK